jgi:hypothetical protein
LFFISYSSVGQHKKDSLKYYSDSCNLSYKFSRQYLSDSVFIDACYNVVDTFLINEGKLFKLHYGSSYKLIDIDEDFGGNPKIYRHYYSNLAAVDTLPDDGGITISYKLKLSQHIVIYIPSRKINLNGRELYEYFITGDCYPVTRELCIASCIANREYGIIYFEKGIGPVGMAAADGKCKYLLT